MVKYELKKLFLNRFILITLISCIALTFAYAAYSKNCYENGNLYTYEAVFLDKNAFREITVTKNNINTLEERISEIEADDRSYDYIDPATRQFQYYGRFADETYGKINEIYRNTESAKEQEEKIKCLESYQISDRLFAEYCILSYVTEQFRELEYRTTLAYFNSFDGVDAKTADELPSKYKSELQSNLTRLESGVTYSSDFGWRELLKAGKASALPVIISILITLAAVTAISRDYETAMYSLIICTKNGRKKILQKKLVSISLFAVMVSVIFNLSALCAYGIFFTLNGKNASSAAVISGIVLTLAQCFPVMTAFSALSALAVGFSALAVSSVCGKSFVASGINLLLIFIPFLFGFFFTFKNENINAFIHSLPVNIPICDFSTSVYFGYTWFGRDIGAGSSFTAFIFMSFMLSVISLPIIYYGWYKQRIIK